MHLLTIVSGDILQYLTGKSNLNHIVWYALGLGISVALLYMS